MIKGNAIIKDETITFPQTFILWDSLQVVENAALELCFGCREPVAPDEKSHPNYEAGVSCMRCAGSHDEKKLANLRQRQMQLELAKSRNEPHIGDEARALQEWKKNKSRAA